MQKIILDTIEEFRKEHSDIKEMLERRFEAMKWVELEDFLKQALTKAFEAGQKSREKEIVEIREKAYKSWWYLIDRDYTVEFGLAKINPKTKRIDDDESKNTEVDYWLEAGLPGEHDIRLDCGGKTIEEAIIKMVKKYKSLSLTKEEDCLLSPECKCEDCQNYEGPLGPDR